MKKIISLNTVLAVALIALTMHKSQAYDIVLANETDFDARIKAINAGPCKDEERQVAAQSSTNKIGNGICNVRRVEADVKNVPLISLFEFEHSVEQHKKESGQEMHQESGRSGRGRTERSRGMGIESKEGSSLYTQNIANINTEEMQTQSDKSSESQRKQSSAQSQQRTHRGPTKGIVTAIEYKGPRTGVTTDTYVLREKKDNQGNPIPQLNKNNKGELVTLSGAIVRDSKNTPITENDGIFLNNKKEDITSDLTDSIKRQIVATPTFEVIRK